MSDIREAAQARVAGAAQGQNWTDDRAEPKLGKIQQELNGLHKSVDRVNSLVINLLDRLDPILQPENEKENKECLVPGYGILIADAIKTQNGKVMRIETMLCGIIGRIEI